MDEDIWDEAENNLLSHLPGPPVTAHIHTTNVWIIEWLSAQDRKTGKLLYDWLEERRSGWAAYSPCPTKAHVLRAIERATLRALHTNMVPVLHIEAHGDQAGLEGPDGNGGLETLSWGELTPPLQCLNEATRCNLLIFVAACTGCSAIQAFCRGPRAPAVALFGPDSRVAESNLLEGTKEFYRRYMDPSLRLTYMVESASQEIGPAQFELEPFAVLAFESMIKALLRDIGSDQWVRELELMRQGVPELQLVWDQLFMIDLWPENRERFGVDMVAVVDTISKKAEVIVGSRA